MEPVLLVLSSVKLALMLPGAPSGLQVTMTESTVSILHNLILIYIGVASGWVAASEKLFYNYKNYEEGDACLNTAGSAETCTPEITAVLPQCVNYSAPG